MGSKRKVWIQILPRKRNAWTANGKMSIIGSTYNMPHTLVRFSVCAMHLAETQRSAVSGWVSGWVSGQAGVPPISHTGQKWCDCDWPAYLSGIVISTDVTR